MRANERWEVSGRAVTANRLSCMYNQEYANDFPNIFLMEIAMGFITERVNYLVR
jgi:hypothetical protein